LTEDGALVGTLPYMAPEQILGEAVDARIDLWAVGVILFELVTGEHPLAPFVLAKLAQVADLARPMPHARDRRPHVGATGDVIEPCLKKRPDERVGSADALAKALEPLRAGGRAIEREEEESPYAGLAAFQEADAARFLGRERDVASMLGRLRNQPLVTVSGPS